MIFLRVIHSNFCMEKIHSKNVWQFLCVHYIVNFCMGKTLTFFVWYFLYGIFVWEKPNIFCVAIFCMVFFFVFDPSFSLFIHPLVLPFLLDTTQLYHHHWIEQGRLPLVHAKKYTLLKIDCSTIVSRMVSLHYSVLLLAA